MTLARQIQAKQRSLGITSNVALAQRIGISLPTLYSVLFNRRVPNVRTIDAYARFLQVSAERIRVMGRIASQVHPRALAASADEAPPQPFPAGGREQA
jgi:hypothetical protein